MKKLLYYIVVPLLTLLVSNCADEEIVSQSNGIRVTGEIETPSRIAYEVGEKAVSVSWVAGDTISLFSENHFSLLQYRAATDGKTTDFIPFNEALLGKEGEKVYAYYPYVYTSYLNNNLKYPKAKLPDIVEQYYNDDVMNPRYDFIYSTGSVHNKQLSLTFHHLFAFLKISIETSLLKEYGYLCLSSDEMISFRNGSYDFAEDSISAYRYKYLDLDLPVDKLKGRETITYYVAILPSSENSTIELVQYGNGKRERLIVKHAPKGGFKAGHIYEFSVEKDLYASTDYSKDGEVVTLQKASAGKGIDLVFVGEAFVDKDMEADGVYERIMRKAMEQFFAFEPYKTFRNRFNVYAVKVVSPNAGFVDGAKHRINENNAVAFEYAGKVPDINLKRLMVTVVYNTVSSWPDRSCCWMYFDGSFVSYVMEGMNETLNHESCGHGFAKLQDEYVEPGNENLTLPDEDKKYLDIIWTWHWGWGANVDYRSTATDIKWAHFLSDERYKDEVGIYEGSYYYGFGAYRPTEDSMMRSNSPWFNAPSREAIYKAIMTLSEGEDWKYDFEEFAAYDAINRGTSKSRSAIQSEKDRKKWRENHRPPVFVKGSWRDAKKNNVVVPLR